MQFEAKNSIDYHEQNMGEKLPTKVTHITSDVQKQQNWIRADIILNS